MYIVSCKILSNNFNLHHNLYSKVILLDSFYSIFQNLIFHHTNILTFLLFCYLNEINNKFNNLSCQSQEIVVVVVVHSFLNEN